MKKTQMTHRERIMAAIDHKPTDRVPMDYWGVGEITEKLMKYFGVNDYLGLSKALDIDSIITIDPPMIKEGRSGVWDVERKQVVLQDGSVYSEPVRRPIEAYETINEIDANYEWPTTDMFDYSGIKQLCEKYRSEGYAVMGGFISLTLHYEGIRGTEQMLLDFAGDSELAEYVLYKINKFASAHAKKILDAGEGLIDIAQVTDDLGDQKGLRMSPEMIERYLGHYYVSNTAMIKGYGARVFHHDDGAIAGLIPWIAEKGCQILNPLQWHLPGWDLKKIKKEYGAKLCFHGGIDNQDILPFKGPEEVKAEVKACIDALYCDRTGYILAPCHNIQGLTPVENVIAMYDFAKKYSM